MGRQKLDSLRFNCLHRSEWKAQRHLWKRNLGHRLGQKIGKNDVSVSRIGRMENISLTKTQAWEHAWNTEWMRIREAQTERFMVDAFGIFYEMPVMSYGGLPLPMKPVSTICWVIPDYVSWRGFWVLASDQGDNAVGQPQSNFMFSHIDQLWSWGKPAGWGSFWQ